MEKEIIYPKVEKIIEYNFLALKFIKAKNVEGNPEQARVMQGIRENYYSDEEIKEWLKNGNPLSLKLLPLHFFEKYEIVVTCTHP